MLIWYFSNILDLYDYVGKLPEQYFSVWFLSNPGDKILFLLKFIEARISEWNIFLSWKTKFNKCSTIFLNTWQTLTPYITQVSYYSHFVGGRIIWQLRDSTTTKSGITTELQLWIEQRNEVLVDWLWDEKKRFNVFVNTWSSVVDLSILWLLDNSNFGMQILIYQT